MSAAADAPRELAAIRDDLLAYGDGPVPELPGHTETAVRMVLGDRRKLRRALIHIEEWCRGIGEKANRQTNFALAATAPRIAEEIRRALDGEPLAYSGSPNDETVRLLGWLRANGHLDEGLRPVSEP